MQRPSLSLIISGLFLGYIAYSIYSLSLLFVAPACDVGRDICLTSYLENAPELELNLFTSATSVPREREPPPRILSVSPFDHASPREINTNVQISKRTRNNGTLFLHVLISPRSARNEKSFHELRENYQTSYTTIKLTRYVVPEAETFKLLGDKKKSAVPSRGKRDNSAQLPVTHLQSRVTFVMMTDRVAIPINRIPMELVNMRVTTNDEYMPIIKYDFLQSRYSDLVLVDEETETMNITVIYTPVSLGKLRLVTQIESAMRNLRKFGFSDKNIDEVKGIYAETNVYLLAGTILIASVHLLFDFLAFKNDISFWRRKNNLQGLSTTTIVWRAFSQTIVFLYLLDENSSLLIIVPAGIGTLIEVWKSKKILRIGIVRDKNFLVRIKIHKHENDSVETKTREFDAECMRYLSYVLYPLVVVGAIYSLLYQPHRSWYSWCINSLVNGVYAFGFLFMLPQLFVNYKLKSVAHLPWRSFMYKAFNTFIDDVFAFIITMPVAHRVACFRDDAVFLVYLYQRWLYPVDKSRLDTATIMEEPSGSTSAPRIGKKDE